MYTIDEIFGREGLLSQQLKNFAPRQQQIDMAYAVSQCLQGNGATVIEAMRSKFIELPLLIVTFGAVASILGILSVRVFTKMNPASVLRLVTYVGSVVMLGAAWFILDYLKISGDSHIVLIGNNLGSRMMNYGFFETEVQLKFPDSAMVIRNMCDGGNTPGFRPHSGRESPWAFPGADEFYTELAKNSGSQGHLETPDQWLTNLQTDVIIAFFV